MLKEQILLEEIAQHNEDTHQLEVIINDLHDQMERKEYVMQFKEAVWCSFESELRKAVSKNSKLALRIDATTEILLENLASKRISNVVIENEQLKGDQRRALALLN